MPYTNIVLQKKEHILYVTINRPKALNALDAKTLDELEEALGAAQKDDDVLVLIVTGAGERAFVAGADIGEITKLDYRSGVRFARRGQELFSRLENLLKPSIAAVNGFALGGGCELAMACTIRIASENAKFGQPEVKLGLIPGYGGTQRLPRLVGKSNAMHLLLTGEMIDAQRALQIGLVSKVVPQDQLIPTAEKIAQSIISMGPIAIRSAVEAVNRGYDLDLPSALMIEADLFGAVCGTEDMKEGTGAFLEKRRAEFKGK